MLKDTFTDIQERIYEEVNDQLDTTEIWEEVNEEFRDLLDERYHELLNERREEMFNEGLRECMAG